MKFFVALNLKSRFPKPAIGKFLRSSEQGGRYVWKREITDDIARLAALTNEASEFLQRNGNPQLLLQICEAVEVTAVPVATEEPAPEAPEETPSPAPLPENPVAEVAAEVVAPVETPTAPVDEAPAPAPVPAPTRRLRRKNETPFA